MKDLVEQVNRQAPPDSRFVVETGALNDAHRKLIGLNQTIRGYTKVNLEYRTLSQVVNYGEWMKNRAVKRTAIFLPILHGCGWKQKCGGCFNCGMAQGLNITLPSAYYIYPIPDIITSWCSNPDSSPEWVCIYNEGSYLNPEELSIRAAHTILEIVAEVESVKRITIESRPEFVTEESLEWLRDLSLTYGCEVEIGLGVEVGNDFVRQYCINKGFTWQEFEEKVRVMTKYGIRSLAYILLKPPFMSESEAIEESIRTIKSCFQKGVNAVSLEIMSIHAWTIVEYLWLKGLYELPSLWSVIDITSKVANLGELRIGGEPATYYPKSLTTAYNCEICTRRIWRRIRQYNEHHNLSILTECSCICKEAWYQKVNEGRNQEGNLKKVVSERLFKISTTCLSLQDYITNKIMKGENHEQVDFYSFN